MITEKQQDLIEEMASHYKFKLMKLINDLEPNEDFDTAYLEFHQNARMIASYFNVEYKILLSRNTRKSDYVYARSVLFWLTKKRKGCFVSLEKIGSLAGGFHHATVKHQIQKFNQEYAYNSDFKLLADHLIEQLGYTIVKVSKENYTPEKLDARSLPV